MGKEKLICSYCGKVRNGISFFVGASLKADWTMWEGTSKVSCDNEGCYLYGKEESGKLIDSIKEEKS